MQLTVDDQLRSVGLKVTDMRKYMLTILSENIAHLTVEQLHLKIQEKLPSVAISSVYRNLIQLESAGLVLRHQFQENAAYELNSGEHHDHLICRNCEKVIEFFDEEIERLQQQVSQKYGFKLQHHVLNLYGLCKACQ